MNNTFFAPQLFINNGVKNINFYINAFGAIELRKVLNDDGTYHVSELTIDGALFQLHEEKESGGEFSPTRINGTTTLIGLFVNNVEAVMHRAVDAGATVISPAQKYDYGYEQGIIKDPFGHHWMIQKKI